MQKYAKLTDGKIEFAPQNKGAISNYNLSVELMTADGYKPLVVVEEPTAEKPLVKYREMDKQIEQYAEGLPVEQKETEVRAVRKQYLYDTDKFMLPDFPITEEERQQYKEYRKYLRDYTETEGWYESNPLTFEEWKEDLNATEQVKTMGDVYGTNTSV
jgi:hypothetical protein